MGHLHRVHRGNRRVGVPVLPNRFATPGASYGPAASFTLLVLLACAQAPFVAFAESRTLDADLADAANSLDQDFAYQGEYLGSVPAAAWGSANLGVQVVALAEAQRSQRGCPRKGQGALGAVARPHVGGKPFWL